MTLGRTSSGAIKIKTDGGLRAVECACCASPCGVCHNLLIPEPLRAVFTNATSATLWGYAARYFFAYPEEAGGGFEAEWVIEVFDDDGRFVLGAETFISYSGVSNCLYGMSLDYITFDNPYIEGVGYFGKKEGCCTITDTCVDSTFSINGQGGFPWHYITMVDGEPRFTPIPAPDLVVS